MAINKILNGVTVGNTTKFNHSTMAPELVYYIDEYTGVGKLPAGGNTNQVATKKSAADFDIIWKTLTAEDIEGAVTKQYVDDKFIQNIGDVRYGGMFDPTTGICILHKGQIYTNEGEILTSFVITKENAANVQGYYFISTATGTNEINTFYPGDWCISNGSAGWSKLSQSGLADGGEKVTGIKGNNELLYRTGDVNLTAADIGAVQAQDLIDAGTACKVKYNEQGLITSGEDLSIDDIPDLSDIYVSKELGIINANKNIITDANGRIAFQELAESGNALVTGIKGAKENSYRTGEVVLSAADIGAVPLPDALLEETTGIKISYNQYGLITGSSLLEASDIPDLSSYYLPKQTIGQANKMLITDANGIISYDHQPIYIQAQLPVTDISIKSLYNIRGNLYYYGSHRRQVQLNDELTYLNININDNYYTKDNKTEKDIILESDIFVYYSIITNNILYVYEENKGKGVQIIYQADLSTNSVIINKGEISYDYTTNYPIVSYVNELHPAYSYFNTIFNEWQYILTDKDCFELDIDKIPGDDGDIEIEIDPTIPDHIKQITTQDIINWNNKADVSYVDNSIANIQIPDIDLTGYATELYVNNQISSLYIPSIDGLASEEYVNNAIKNIPTIDLTDYATEVYVNTQLSSKANIGDVLTKNNTTPFTPTANYQPATKKYVDTKSQIVEISLQEDNMLNKIYDASYVVSEFERAFTLLLEEGSSNRVQSPVCNCINYFLYNYNAEGRLPLHKMYAMNWNGEETEVNWSAWIFEFQGIIKEYDSTREIYQQVLKTITVRIKYDKSTYSFINKEIPLAQQTSPIGYRPIFANDITTKDYVDNAITAAINEQLTAIY